MGVFEDVEMRPGEKRTAITTTTEGGGVVVVVVIVVAVEVMSVGSKLKLYNYQVT